jgi:hypothetical protein
VAIQAVFPDYTRRMVSLCIEPFGKGQYFSGAILNAISATFTTFLDNMNLAGDYGNLVRIERNPPEFHESFPVWTCKVWVAIIYQSGLYRRFRENINWKIRAFHNIMDTPMIF